MPQDQSPAIRHAATAAATSAALVLALAASPASAQPADDQTTWLQVATAEGCIVIWTRANTMSAAEARRIAQLSYQGSGCQRGQLINGEGSLTYGSYRNSYRGRFVDGVLQGQVEAYVAGKLDPDASGNWVGGCSPHWSKWAGCIPYRGGAESIVTDAGPGPLGLRDGQFASGGGGGGGRPAPAPAALGGSGDGDVWSTCVTLEDPVQSGIQVIYAFRNICSKTVTIAFCMQATYEAAGDWNLCSQGSYKTYDIRAGARFEFPFTPVTAGSAMSDGRVVDRNDIRASGAACIGSNPSIYVRNKALVFQHC